MHRKRVNRCVVSVYPIKNNSFHFSWNEFIWLAVITNINQNNVRLDECIIKSGEDWDVLIPIWLPLIPQIIEKPEYRAQLKEEMICKSFFGQYMNRVRHGPRPQGG